MSREILGRYESSSSSTVYEVYRANDGNLVCGCMSWRMSKQAPKACKHTDDVAKKSGAAPATAAPVQAVAKPVAAPAIVPAANKVAAKAKGLPEAMNAQEVGKAPTSPWGSTDWVAELKLDGMRLLSVFRATGPSFYSRNHNLYSYDWAKDLCLPEGTILDGELVEAGGVVVWGGGGRKVDEYRVFDVLQLGDQDLRHQPWTFRRQVVEMVVEKMGHPQVKAIEVLGEPTEEVLTAALAHGFEGLMLKRKAAPYQEGKRSWDWLKVKPSTTYDRVIVDAEGMPTAEDRAAAGWRNLRYGAYIDGVLVVQGTVGQSRPVAEWKDYIGQVVEMRAWAESPETGALRHPQVIKLRPDKPASSCIFERGK